MVHAILANYVASISDLKKQPMSIMEAGHGEAVAILNHNEPVFYCVPANLYESICELVDDAELVKIIQARANEEEIKISLDDL
ncbi:MAG: type II toxin-antitoxin system Phd/YefM family antitoxin [Gammaproteobacteria bacterium]